jgi:SAM-dependent methyltransferase
LKKESLVGINKALRSLFRRLGIELQLMPLPKRTTAPSSSEFAQKMMNSSVNWLRVPMYDAIFSCLNKDLPSGFFKDKVAIEIGGSEGSIASMLKSLGASLEVAPNYPEVDVERLPYKPASYDVIVLDQTLEHLRHPWIAVDQLRRVLRPGGLAICTSVFVYPLHKFGPYDDYYRFSPEGFRAIFEGFKVLSADGWGSAEVLRMAYDHSERGPEGSDPVSKLEAKSKGLYDYSDKMNYVMTWCVAQKVDVGGFFGGGESLR